MTIENISFTLGSLIFAIVSTGNVNASTCQQTSMNQSYFVNGIHTSEFTARQSALKIGQLLKTNVKLNYNHTDGLLSDLIEASRQKYGSFNSERTREILSPTTPVAWRDAIIQSWHSKFNTAFVRSPDLKDHVARYTADLHAGRKVSVIAHSQGNFYANESRLLLTATLSNDQLKGFGIFGLAVPANNVGGIESSSAPYLTNSLDIISSIPGSMPANVVLLNSDGTKANISGLSAHGLQETYLSPSFNLRSMVLSGIRSLTSSLTSPQPVCGSEAMNLVSYFAGTYTAKLSNSTSASIDISSSGSVTAGGRSVLEDTSSLGSPGVTTSFGLGQDILAIDTNTSDRLILSFKSGLFELAYLQSTSTSFSPLGTSSMSNTTGPAPWMFGKYSWIRDYLQCDDSKIRIASLSAGQFFLSGLPPIQLTNYTKQLVNASRTPNQEGATVNVGLTNATGDALDVAFSASSGIQRVAMVGKPTTLICLPLGKI